MGNLRPGRWDVLKRERSGKSVWDLAVERCKKAYELCDKVVVSFSGGKDSTATLMATIAAAEELGKLPVETYFFDEEAIPPETIDYVGQTSLDPRVQMNWLCVPIRHRNGCSKEQPFWYPWASEERDRWVRPLPTADVLLKSKLWVCDKLPSSILPSGTLQVKFPRVTMPDLNTWLFPPDQGNVAILQGIRTAESLRRFMTVTRKAKLNYFVPCHYDRRIMYVYPIYDWETHDVWTLPGALGIDYNTTYDKLRLCGLTAHAQRVAPPYGEEPMRGLWQYGLLWPEMWEKMMDRVPGAATAARYARGPLYGYGSKEMEDEIGLPPDRDPRQVVEEAICIQPDEIREKLRNRIRMEMRYHFKVSPGVPVPRSEMGKSGITWEMLYNVAMRGDFKRRRGRQISGKTGGSW